MNRREHFIIGLVVFFVYNFINSFLIDSVINPIFGITNTSMWLIGAIAVTLGSVIPDEIEPATHWTHRGTFHSKKTLNLTMKLFGVTAAFSLFYSPIFYVASFFLGYSFHLLADSMTKVGLPDIPVTPAPVRKNDVDITQMVTMKLQKVTEPISNYFFENDDESE